MKEHTENFGKILKIFVIVSAIILVLGGYYLWRNTRFNSEARAIARYLISIKTTREETISASGDEKNQQTENGPFGTTFNIENGIGKRNKDFFWINTVVYDSTLCEYLAEIDVGAKKVDKSDCDDKKEVTFYFPKFKDKSKGSPDIAKQPKGCPKNAECDAEDNIINCLSGFYLSDAQCNACPKNSINCEGETFECEIGYYPFEAQCLSCGKGVRSCNENGEPTECMPDFYPMDGKCVPCSSLGPGFCTPAPSAPSTYTPISRPVQNTTKSRTSVPQKTSTESVVCQDGYYKKNGSCMRCPSNYETCDKSTGYFTCQSGYVKNSDKTACVRQEGCASKAAKVKFDDSNTRLNVENNTIVITNNSSRSVVISQDLDFAGCDLKINTSAETRLLGNIYAKNLTITAPDSDVFTYSGRTAPKSSNKKIHCSGDLKINGDFYSDRSMDILGNLIITRMTQMAPAKVHIGGYVSGQSIATQKDVQTPIVVDRYVSVSDYVHNVKSADYINASVISAGEAENSITVEQIALNGKLVCKNGDIVVTDAREKSDSNNLYTVHVDFGSEISVLNGQFKVVSGLNFLNLGKVQVSDNMDIVISGIFRNWNQLLVGGNLILNNEARFAGINRPNGSRINSKTIVCGEIYGSGDIQLDTVATLDVGGSISTSLKTKVVKYDGQCEKGEGKLSASHASYNIQNYTTYLNANQCMLNKGNFDGPFSMTRTNNCQNISWCQQNRYCF